MTPQAALLSLLGGLPLKAPRGPGPQFSAAWKDQELLNPLKALLQQRSVQGGGAEPQGSSGFQVSGRVGGGG